MKTKSTQADRGKLGVHLLVIIFGITSWSMMNALWVELPILVTHLPEGWTLPSYLMIIAQCGNLGPLVYSLLVYLFPHTKLETPASVVIVIALTLSALMYSFSWKMIAVVGGTSYSVALHVVTLIQAVFASMSSISYLAFMAHLKVHYISSIFIGMGLSGLIPAFAATGQGTAVIRCVTVGDTGGLHNDTINVVSLLDQNSSIADGFAVNSTLYTANSTIHAENEEPAFTVMAFFLMLFGLGLLSLLSLLMLIFHPYCKTEHVDTDKEENCQLMQSFRQSERHHTPDDAQRANTTPVLTSLLPHDERHTEDYEAHTGNEDTTISTLGAPPRTTITNDNMLKSKSATDHNRSHPKTPGHPSRVIHDTKITNTTDSEARLFRLQHEPTLKDAPKTSEEEAEDKEKESEAEQEESSETEDFQQHLDLVTNGPKSSDKIVVGDQKTGHEQNGGSEIANHIDRGSHNDPSTLSLTVTSYGSMEKSFGDSTETDHDAAAGAAILENAEHKGRQLNKCESWYLLGLLVWINMFQAGFSLAIQVYSSLPYGLAFYSAVTEAENIVDPIASFITLYKTAKSVRVISGLTLLGTLFTAYIISVAAMSPHPFLVNETAGGVLIIAAWVMCTMSMVYSKVSIAGLMRVQGRTSLMWSGGSTQFGSLLGAIMAYLMVNQFHLFKNGPWCQ